MCFFLRFAHAADVDEVKTVMKLTASKLQLGLNGLHLTFAWNAASTSSGTNFFFFLSLADCHTDPKVFYSTLWTRKAMNVKMECSSPCASSSAQSIRKSAWAIAHDPCCISDSSTETKSNWWCYLHPNNRSCPCCKHLFKRGCTLIARRYAFDWANVRYASINRQECGCRWGWRWLS